MAKEIIKPSEKNQISIDIIVDNREINPWEFKLKLPSGLVINKIMGDTLEGADYTISGYDMPWDDYSIIIERKANIPEFIKNIGKKWEEFKRVLEHMSGYHTKEIIIEDDLNNAQGRYKMRRSTYFSVSPEFLVKRIGEIKSYYGITTHFLTNRYNAQKYVLNLFKNAVMLNERSDCS